MGFLEIKIRNKILLVLFFLFIISFLTWFAISHIEKESKLNIQKALKTVLITTQEALHLWVDERLNEATIFVTDKKLISATKILVQAQDENQVISNQPSQQRLKEHVLAKLPQSQFTDFSVIALNNIVIASTFKHAIGLESIISQQRKYYLNLVFSGQTVFIPTIQSDLPAITLESGKIKSLRSIYVVAPIFDDSNKVMAAFSLRLDPQEHFTRIFNLGRIGNTGESYAFDNSGMLITRSRFDEDLKDIGTIGNNDVGMMSIWVTDPGGNLKKGYVKLVTNKDLPLTLMASRAIAGDFTDYPEAYRDYRGVPVYGSWLWDNILDIGITTEIDVDEALLPHKQTRIIIMVTLAIIITLSLGVISLFFWIHQRENIYLRRTTLDLEEVVNERTLALKKANERLKELSEVDPLTCIANRRLYEYTLNNKIRGASRAQQPLSLLMIDIDYFKLFNDNYGHDNGDIALKNVAAAIVKALPRATDFVARYGGEEFVVLLTATDATGAFTVAERIRLQIESLAIKHEFSNVLNVVTVSIGLSSLTGSELNGADLFKQADSALYKAKNSSRNKTAIFQ